DEPDAGSACCIDVAVARQQQLARVLVADDPGKDETDDPAAVPDFGCAETAVIGGNRDVAQCRDFHGTAEAVPVHGSNDWLGAIPEAHDYLEIPLELPAQVVASRGRRRALDIEAGRKCPAVPVQQDGAHVFPPFD